MQPVKQFDTSFFTTATAAKPPFIKDRDGIASPPEMKAKLAKAIKQRGAENGMQKAANKAQNCTFCDKMRKTVQFKALKFFISELKLLTLCREKSIIQIITI